MEKAAQPCTTYQARAVNAHCSNCGYFAKDHARHVDVKVGPLEHGPADLSGRLMVDPVTRWPFRESPGDFANRLLLALQDVHVIWPGEAHVLSAVRTVLIEEPPALAAWLDPGAAAQDSADYDLLKIALRHAFPDFQDAEPITTERVFAVGKKFNEAVIAASKASEPSYSSGIESAVFVSGKPYAIVGRANGWAFKDPTIEIVRVEPLVDTRRERKISTSFVHPPIPFRQFNWFAYFDGDEPDDEGNMLHGYGATEAEAIAELKLMAEDNDIDIYELNRAAEDGDIDIYEAPPASPAPDGTSIELCHCGPDSRMNHYKGSRGCVHEKKHAPDCATHCRDQARHQHPCDCGAEVKS